MNVVVEIVEIVLQTKESRDRTPAVLSFPLTDRIQNARALRTRKT